MIQGTIIKIEIQKDNSWGKYIVETYCGTKKEEKRVVGVIPNAAVGSMIVIDGHDESTKWGDQYTITSVIRVEEGPNAGVLRFLSDGYIKGIGTKKAQALVDMFGDKVLEILEDPQRRNQLMAVKGISTEVVKKAAESYEDTKKYAEIVLLLQGCVTRHQVELIYEKYGNNAVKTLKRNPYRLQMDLDGFGFKRADELALKAGITYDSKYRIMAAIKYCIEQASTMEGHCFLPVSDISGRVEALLVPIVSFKDISERVAKNALSKWNEETRKKLISAHKPEDATLEQLEQIATDRASIEGRIMEALSEAVAEGDLINDDGKIYTKAMYEKESGAARLIAEMIKANPVRFISPERVEAAIKTVEQRKTAALKAAGSPFDFAITKEQRDAVYLGLMHRIAVISGGPGRGKTAISEVIAEGFLNSGKQYNEKDIIMLAPTGRAAKRITESTGFDAMTAHRAIIAAKQNGNPKDKLILVDESSMVDITLLLKILKFAKDCNIIFVGDVDQIASVGPGRVLADLIASEQVPYILLKEGHRNSGSIAQNSVLINKGEKIGKYFYDKHFIYVPCNKDNICDVMVADYIKKIKEYGIQNVMLCAAMKERGCVATNKLNNILQEALTKGRKEATFGKKLFRVGDRVMQTLNDYKFMYKNDGDIKIGVFNGDRGSVINIVPDVDNDSEALVVQFDDGSIGCYTKNTAQNLELAYATTLHKCQGSEAPCMMMAYTFGDYMLLNRSLFYTGETRAKEEFRFYGEQKLQYGRMYSAFDLAVSRVDDAKRNTYLAERINNVLAA